MATRKATLTITAAGGDPISGSYAAGAAITLPGDRSITVRAVRTGSAHLVPSAGEPVALVVGETADLSAIEATVVLNAIVLDDED